MDLLEGAIFLRFQGTPQLDKLDLLSMLFITAILLEVVDLGLRITRFLIQICDMHLLLPVGEGVVHVTRI